MNPLRIARTALRPAGVRFCDRCSCVTTAAQRAAARREAAVVRALAWSPRI